MLKNNAELPEFKFAKDYAYENGKLLYDLVLVMSIYLRDKALPVLGFDGKESELK